MMLNTGLLTKIYFNCLQSPLCGATDNLCFGLWLTLPMGFKARVDVPLPALYSRFCIMDPSCQLGLLRTDLVQILHLGMGRLLLE